MKWRILILNEENERTSCQDFPTTESSDRRLSLSWRRSSIAGKSNQTWNERDRITSVIEKKNRKTSNILDQKRTSRPEILWLFWHPTTSFLTATTLIYTIGAGITAAAGTRLALQLFLEKGFKLLSFQLQTFIQGIVLLFIVTTSLCQDWVIFAPAAFLGSGSRFSGSLSGIEP